MKFGICCDVSKIELAKDAGADYVELNLQQIASLGDDDFSNLVSLSKEKGIEVYSANCMIPGNIKLLGPDYDENKLREYLDFSFKRARELGIKRIVLGSGGARNVPKGYDYSLAYSDFERSIIVILEYAQKNDIVVVLEPLNKKETNIINSSLEGYIMVKKINKSHFKLLVDLYHFGVENEGIDTLDLIKDEISHIHIASVPERKLQMSYDAMLDEFISKLEKFGYNGGISLEGSLDDFDSNIYRVFEFLNNTYKGR